MVSIQDLKPQLSAIVADAQAGETVVITRHGKPVAQLGPAAPPHVHRGANAGAGTPLRSVTSGLGAKALAVLLEDRGDR